MQNPNSETPAPGQNSQQPASAAPPITQTGNAQEVVQQQGEVLAKEAKKQAENLANVSKEQVANMGNAMQGQVQNLGQAGVNQMQNLGKSGVAGLGNMVGQFANPAGGSQTPQPKVTKDEKVYGAIAYIPFISLVCIILKPDSAFVRLHAKQGLLLTIIFLFVGILAAIVSVFGIIGQLLSILLGLIPLGCFVIGIYSMYLAMTGFWWKIPVLSSVADLIPVEMMAKVSKENITGQVGIAKNDYDNRQETLKKESGEVKADVVPPVMQNANTVTSTTTASSVQNTTSNTVQPSTEEQKK